MRNAHVIVLSLSEEEYANRLAALHCSLPKLSAPSHHVGEGKADGLNSDTACDNNATNDQLVEVDQQQLDSAMNLAARLNELWTAETGILGRPQADSAEDGSSTEHKEIGRAHV